MRYEPFSREAGNVPIICLPFGSMLVKEISCPSLTRFMVLNDSISPAKVRVISFRSSGTTCPDSGVEDTSPVWALPKDGKNMNININVKNNLFKLIIHFLPKNLYYLVP
jgi:hypothetical protein